MRDLNGTAAAILGLLSTGDHSAYDVAGNLRSMVGDFWNITTSQVYRELETMAKEGLAEAGPRGRRDRRAYHLTESGRDALDDWLAQPAPGDVVRIPVLLKLFMLFALDRQDDAALARLIAAYRADHAERAAEYRKQHAELEAAELPYAHLTRYGLFHEEAILRWLDTLPWSDTNVDASLPVRETKSAARRGKARS